MIFKVETGEGFPDSNSYASVADADAYVAFFFPEDTTWSSKTQAEKELKMIMATRFVDSLLRWNGEILVADQALNWPRTTFKDSQGRTIPAGTIPDKLVGAVCLLAFESLENNIYDEGVLLTSQKYGSSSETYAGPVRDGGNFYTMQVLKEFRDLGYGGSKSSMVTLYRA